MSRYLLAIFLLLCSQAVMGIGCDTGIEYYVYDAGVYHRDYSCETKQMHEETNGKTSTVDGVLSQDEGEVQSSSFKELFDTGGTNESNSGDGKLLQGVETKAERRKRFFREIKRRLQTSNARTESVFSNDQLKSENGDSSIGGGLDVDGNTFSKAEVEQILDFGPDEYTQEDKDLIEDRMERAWRLVGTPYLLGGKTTQAIDCSGLISVYAHERGVRDKSFSLNNLNSTTLSKLGRQKELGSLARGDILYFKKQGGGVNHIATVVSQKNGYSFTILDASYGLGVSKRTIAMRNGVYITDDGEHSYTVTGHMNPVVELARKLGHKENITSQEKLSPGKYVGNFKVTRYVPSRGGINCGGGGCGHFADGGAVSQAVSGKVISCPYPDLANYSCMVDPNRKCPRNPRLGKRFFIPGHGEVVCKDVGGLINMKGQINTRGNVSSSNKIDIFTREADYTAGKFAYGNVDLYLLD